MHLITYSIILFTFINLSASSDCIDLRTQQNVLEVALHNDLLDGYNTQSPPRNKTIVIVDLMLADFKMDDNKAVLTIYSFLMISWLDKRLTWDPSRYADLSETSILPMEIWTPKMELINDLPANDMKIKSSYPCKLTQTGEVMCRVEFLKDLSCSMNVSNWPYDTQNCSLTISVQSKSTSISIFSMPIVSPFAMQGNREWNILPYGFYPSENCTNKQVINFVVTRDSQSVNAIIIYPCIALSILTFMSLFLDARNNERLFILCFSFLCHLDFLTEMSTYVPKKSPDSPTILIYFCVSMVMTILLIISTLSLNQLCKIKTDCNNLKEIINEYMFKSYVQLLVWPRWKIESPQCNKQLTKLANIINSFVIYMFVILYGTLYYTLMPEM